MKAQEKLYSAIGGVDARLIARSDRRRRKRWPGYCLAAAACLTLVLAVGRVLPSRTEPVATPPDTQRPPSGVVTEPNIEQSYFPERGSEIGALRLLSAAPQSQEKTVDFLIYVNEEGFSICEENGLYSIRNINPLPDGFPECGLDILHLFGKSPIEARNEAEEPLKERRMELLTEEESPVLPGSLYLRASAGTDWDSEQAELWFVNDGQGGTFVLTARYFLEAEEGLGTSFRDMASSFRIISLSEPVPEWMRSLYETTDRLFPALFSNDLSGVSDLLAEDADVDAYDENVWDSLTIASVDYAPENDQDPASAVVSVKHRLNLEEGESYNYLTMELIRQGGQWLLDWSGIEK